MKNKEDDKDNILIIAIVAIVACIVLWIGGMFISHWYAGKHFVVSNSENAPALFGDSFGAVNALISAFAFAGVIVAIIIQRNELRLQRQDLKLQRDEFSTQNDTLKFQRFEATFFNLFNVQQNITNDLKVYFFSLKDLTTVEHYPISGREFFRIATIQKFRINSALSTSKYLGVYDESQDEIYIDELGRIEEQSRLEPDPNYSEQENKKIINERKQQLINKIYGISKEKWEMGHALAGVERVSFVFDLFFEKYQYAIGHYFRNLYHIIKYVKTFEVSQLNETTDAVKHKEIKDKCKQYTRFIQAQMSSYELALLHDNSLKFPEMLKLVKEYNLLDNCSEKGLIHQTNYTE